MRRITKALSYVLAAALWAGPTSAPASESSGTIISLYREGSIPSLGVPETSVKLAEAGETIVFNVSNPTLELFRPTPERANGTAVIIAPGGGFVGLGYENGGVAIARQLARRGVTALVLKYRTIESTADPMTLPEVHMREMETIMARAKSGLPLEVPPFAGEQPAVEDGARAMMIVRERAVELGIDPQRVGLLGLSAGAFLAVDLAIGDKVTRPDFVALLYGGLRTPVPADAPAAFIAAAADDAFLPEDSVQLYSAWRRAGVPAELHIYERGGHGFDLNPKGATSDHWFDELIWWLESRDLMGKTGSGLE